MWAWTFWSSFLAGVENTFARSIAAYRVPPAYQHVCSSNSTVSSRATGIGHTTFDCLQWCMLQSFSIIHLVCAEVGLADSMELWDHICSFPVHPPPILFRSLMVAPISPILPTPNAILILICCLGWGEEVGFKRLLTCFSCHSSYFMGQGPNVVVIPTISFLITHLGTEEMTTG